ncbi:MAG: TIR domain-containing protein [Chloroflexota bacterium]|nr:TIR domain-containing protein [Chloroflexota bacterium]
MAEQSDYLYDVFISYSQADREWVNEWLLPRLEQAGLRAAVDYRDFTIGMPRIENIERAVESSRRTVVILTPDWLASEWNGFEALLLRTTDPAARQRKLLPVLLKPCELPDLIASLEKADLTVERHWEKQIKRLTRDIEDVIPVPAPWKKGGVRDFTQWKRWGRRYRRELRRGAGALFLLWLTLSMLLQLPPFQLRDVWVSLGLDAPYATQLMNVGDVLLVGGANVEEGCKPLGPWRSVNDGDTWQSSNDSSLCFEHSEQEYWVADIQGFAGNTSRVYAATSDVGLLRSDDAGTTWDPTGDLEVPRPDLIAVAANPENIDRVYVAHRAGGLFRSGDGGDTWQRLDMQSDEVVCEKGAPLTGNLVVGAMAVTPDHVIVGTGNPDDLSELDTPGGLYLSADEGICWQQPAEVNKWYEYLELAYASAADDLFILVHNWRKGPEEEWNQVLRLDLTASNSSPQSLWQTQHTVGALLVDGDSWYIATRFGRVMQGSILGTAPPEELSSFLLPCILDCDVALTPDTGAGAPLLLAGRWNTGGMVLRRQKGPWWHSVWP